MILAMMTYVTIGVILFLIGVAFGMHHFGPIFAEIEDRFLHIVAALLVLVICAGVYLSFAVPSLAGENPYEPEDGKIFRDTVQGLSFEE